MKNYNLSFTPNENNRFFSANIFYKKLFGEKVYKLALDAQMTCPNRDGTKGTGGCIFCSKGGSGDFAEKITATNTADAINKAKERVFEKSSAKKFIAYFQSFTNTYAPTEHLESLFEPIISLDEIAALSIATRPDCIKTSDYELIARLCEQKPVFVELGLQTAHEQTVQLIRRGYPTIDYERAVSLLKRAGANVITHVILGLPGENKKMMLETVKKVDDCNSDGIKLQLLHVLKYTDLAKMYEEKTFEVLSKEEYIDILCDCVNYISSDTVIHRLTGDAPKKILIAPSWSADKKSVINTINATFKQKNVLQGKLSHNH